MSDETIRDRAAIRNLPDDDETITRVVQRVHAALNSGRDKAVVDVVLSETETLRAGCAELNADVHDLETTVNALRDELALVRDTLTRRSAAHDRSVATIQRVREVANHLEGSLAGTLIAAALDPEDPK